jgi:hypothetical protein
MNALLTLLPTILDQQRRAALFNTLSAKSDLGIYPIAKLGAGWRGPYPSKFELADLPGLYAVIDVSPTSTRLLDLGQSDSVGRRMRTHDRQVCWERQRIGIVQFAVNYMPGSSEKDRLYREALARLAFEPVCGER